MKKLILAVLTSAFASMAFAFQPVVTVPFLAGISQNMSAKITSTPAAMVNATQLSLDSVQFDASAYTQARIVVSGGAVAFNGTTSVLVRYQPNTSPSFKDNTFSDYLQAGASSTEVEVTPGTDTATVYVGAWTTLDSGTAGDCVFTFGAVDTANANKQPYYGSLAIQFR